MYGNIVSAVSQYLTPDLIAKMASASGISDRSMTQKVVAAAAPAILSSLANLASKPSGERQLTEIVARQSPQTLENLASVGGGAGQFADMGKNALSTLLGGGSFSSLVNAIGKFAGIGEGAAGSILGMLTPVILGVLGREAGSGPNGLAQLLISQKDTIAAAMPAGLSDVLRTSGLGDRIGSVASSNETYRAPRETPDRMVHAVSPARSAPSPNWVYWALPFLALAGLAWYFLSGDRTNGPAAVAPQATTIPPVQGTVANLGLQTITTIDSLNTSLQGVKDGASATQVLPKLQQAASELDRLSGLAGRLPVEARDQLAERIKTATGRLKTALDNVTAMPGLAPDVQPAIAALQAKLSSLAMTPGSVAQQRIGAVADKAGYLARLASDATSISTYFDRRVYNGAGEEIGTIHDLVMSPEGKIATAVIGVGGFLGIGEKEVAVPFSSIQVERRDSDWRLVMSATKEELKAAPAYENIGPRVHLTPAPASPRN